MSTEANEKEAKKSDEGKLRLDLIPFETYVALADVLEFGAKKYGDYNWQKGMSWSRVYAATLRHLLSWWAGETKDPESGRSHLWHALANLVFLVTFESRKLGEDDRRPV